nr:MAG TPA: hypothetical protein [Caudoviricetes sp.]
MFKGIMKNDLFSIIYTLYRTRREIFLFYTICFYLIILLRSS